MYVNSNDIFKIKNHSASKESFSRNAAKLWNSAPQNITAAKSLSAAKREIKKHCKMLPI